MQWVTTRYYFCIGIFLPYIGILWQILSWVFLHSLTIHMPYRTWWIDSFKELSLFSSLLPYGVATKMEFVDMFLQRGLWICLCSNLAHISIIDTSYTLHFFIIYYNFFMDNTMVWMKNSSFYNQMIINYKRCNLYWCIYDRDECHITGSMYL